jgi:hypothetical protein
MGGGDQLDVAGARGDGTERIGGGPAIVLPPGGETLGPGALDRPFAGAGAGQGREAAGIGVAADRVI